MLSGFGILGFSGPAEERLRPTDSAKKEKKKKKDQVREDLGDT